jgi:hypothetical protein
MRIPGRESGPALPCRSDPVHRSRDKAMGTRNQDSKHGDVLARDTQHPDRLQHGRDAFDGSARLDLRNRSVSTAGYPPARGQQVRRRKLSLRRVIADEAPSRAVAAGSRIGRSCGVWSAPARHVIWLDQLPMGVRPREVPRLFPGSPTGSAPLVPPALCNQYLSSLADTVTAPGRVSRLRSQASLLRSLAGRSRTAGTCGAGSSTGSGCPSRQVTVSVRA